MVALERLGCSPPLKDSPLLDSPKLLYRSNSYKLRSNQFNLNLNNQKSILKKFSQLPNRKKSISFSNSIEVIKHFEKLETPKSIAKSDLVYVQDNGDVNCASLSSTLLIPKFWSLKCHNIHINHSLHHANVLLDQHSLYNNSFRISILVKNLSFQKYVNVRFTTDNWKTIQNVPAIFQGSMSNDLDRFLVVLNLEELLTDQFGVLEFAIQYKVNGVEYWDNNNYQNYQMTLERPLPKQFGKPQNRIKNVGLRKPASLPLYTENFALSDNFYHPRMVQLPRVQRWPVDKMNS